MIVGIDTIASDDGGHRGTGGGGGEEQGGIVGEGEQNIRRETLCTSAGRDMRWAGRCMYVCEYVHTIRCMGCGICISLSAASLTLSLAVITEFGIRDNIPNTGRY